jgi:hypothetical protein
MSNYVKIDEPLTLKGLGMTYNTIPIIDAGGKQVGYWKIDTSDYLWSGVQYISYTDIAGMCDRFYNDYNNSLAVLTDDGTAFRYIFTSDSICGKNYVIGEDTTPADTTTKSKPKTGTKTNTGKTVIEPLVSAAPAKSNTMLYVGIGAAALAVLYFATKKKGKKR